MKILIVSSEVVPYAKTGGLADVAGSLPTEFARLGHDVRVAMPKYGSINEEAFSLIPILADISVNFPNSHFLTTIRKSVLLDTRIPIYFVQNDELFDREGLYQEKGADYPDNAVRFAVFCKAVIWMLKALDWMPDIIHCNDWQTALIPVYLRTSYEMNRDEALTRIRTIYTIHNLAYQGLFDRADGEQIGIGEELFHPAALEFYGRVNLMKGGILFSDRITTVSPTYATEIQTREYGAGLEGVLALRSSHITGILNGIDTNVWNPETDPLIPANFHAGDLAGKATCKRELQKEVGLEVSPETPLIGIISRLDPQKGFDLIAEAIPRIMVRDVQIVLLGTGAPEYHNFFTKVASQNPGKISVNLKFDNGLAHRIEAGSDLFLMPSKYEPCGLNQLYSLRYGTIPIVRKTGGLADSISDAGQPSALSEGGTGFVFEEYSARALSQAVLRALDMHADKVAWTSIMKNAMEKDFSWETSARRYIELFEDVLAH